MKIEIETDGSPDGTVIKFNGVVQTDLREFSFSVRSFSKGAKMQVIRQDEKGLQVPSSFYGGDFEKFDTPQAASNEGLIGSKVNKDSKAP